MTTKAHPSPNMPTNWNLDYDENLDKIKEVLLSSHPRSGEKNDSDTGRETGMAQTIRGHDVNVQSNHPGAEGLHTCHLSLQLGVEGDKRQNL